jgi:hypothetical protein
MRSQRFHREVAVTRHARQRMTERRIDDARLLDLIDSGETRYKDATHLWIYKTFADREMHRFQLS